MPYRAKYVGGGTSGFKRKSYGLQTDRKVDLMSLVRKRVNFYTYKTRNDVLNSASGTTLTLDTRYAQGDHVLVFCTWGSGSGSATITDGTHTYAQVGSTAVDAGNSQSFAIFEVVSATKGSYTLTFTPPASVAWRDFGLAILSDVAGSALPIVSNVQINPATTTDAITSGNITPPSNGPAVLIGWCFGQDGTAGNIYAAGTGFAGSIDFTNYNITFMPDALFEHKLINTSSPVAATFTTNKASGNRTMAIATIVPLFATASGSLAATESATQDSVAIVGNVPVSGALSVTESGSDTVNIVGSTLNAIASLTVSFDANPDPSVTGHYVVYDTVSHAGGVYSDYAHIIDVVGATSVLIPTLIPGTTYYIAVQSHGAGGHDAFASDLSTEVAIVATAPVLGALDATETDVDTAALSGTAGVSGTLDGTETAQDTSAVIGSIDTSAVGRISVDITASTDPNVVGYAVGYDTVSHAGSVDIADYANVIMSPGASSKTVVINGLVNGATYYIGVSAYGLGGLDGFNSEPSAEVSIVSSIVTTGSLSATEDFGPDTIFISGSNLPYVVGSLSGVEDFQDGSVILGYDIPLGPGNGNKEFVPARFQLIFPEEREVQGMSRLRAAQTWLKSPKLGQSGLK
jgi:hypothetical protein